MKESRGAKTYLTTSALCSVAVVVFVFCACTARVSGLVVTEFPHFQTFDSWPDCWYDGLCYEQECTGLMGGWVNPEWHPPVAPYTTDVYHWWLAGGETTSNMYWNATMLPCDDIYTGPCGDHTSGTGKYLFTEASGCFGFSYKVLSPVVLFSNSNANVSFYYYMHGSDLSGNGQPGNIVFSVSVDNSTSWQTIKTISGQQHTSGTQPWGYFEAILDPYFPGGVAATSANPIAAQFQFYATAAGTRVNFGNFWQADMMIDDVVFTQAGASNVLVPYIDPVPQNNTVNPVVDTSGGDGLSDGQIAGIVVGVVGGIGALCCLLCFLLLILLLAISPKKKKVTETDNL